MQFYVSCLLFIFRLVHVFPGGVLPNKEVGGLGPHIMFGGKIWGKVWPSSQNKRKNLGRSVTKRRKSWEKVPILGSYLKFRGQNLGYLSFIFLDAIFGAPTRISKAKFGAKPPDLLIWKYPLGMYSVRIYSRGALPNKEVRGLGPHIRFGGKIWGKVRPSSQNKRKNWEVLSPKDAKVGKKYQFRGHI